MDTFPYKDRGLEKDPPPRSEKTLVLIPQWYCSHCSSRRGSSEDTMLQRHRIVSTDLFAFLWRSDFV